MRRRTWVGVVALAACLMLSVAAPAWGTYPGKSRTLISKRTSGTTFQLRALNPTKGKSRLLIPADGGSIFAGQFSPDGKRIAYFENPGGGDHEIWTAKADGSNAKQFTDNANEDSYPTWSPSGTTIAWAQDGDLVAQNLDGSNFHTITTWGTSAILLPNWSPAGKFIVFNSWDGTDIEVFRIRPSGNDPLQLTSNSVSDWLGDWSPNGKRIVFARDDGAGTEDIFTMRPGGANQAPLIVAGADDFTTPVYSANGRFVLFNKNAGPYEIWRANAKTGKQRRQLTPSSTDFYLSILP